MPREKDKSKAQWTAKISFVPFESKVQRDQAYRQWVRAFLRVKNKKPKEKEYKPESSTSRQFVHKKTRN